ncbi:SpoIID/LytB domain-containing protein [Botrimarina hoheduenensis]|uniref:Stage II sporulation protein n=1 Tax=Botrimarina hoheduenensis TaxID=2528000 RepID=A0A5C5VZE0_9BACT|nr:SpoIID/LytB domain-containing protein [Botrimarina hoheduenensis]TWT43131.1 Stage II sporulation protein [Botrimarina hoheduenensis]
MESRNGRFFGALAAALSVLVLSAGPARGQSEFNARPTITVDVDNNPALRRNVPTESEYVPGVVVSENGLASFEALKAQAVAARTFAYFIVDDRPSGVIGDGQNDQVFSGSTPRAIHYAAAQATEGEILWVRDTVGVQRDVLIASFYVAGAIPTAPFNPASPSARPAPGAPSTGNTERFVTYTYEDGLFAGNNLGTTLGFVGSPTNPNWPNRGAKSQNGADYLSDNSINYLDILKYYYGADIQVRTAKTAGTGVEFSRKVLTDFDDYGSGRASDGVIGGHEGVFGRAPTFSGSTTANLAGSTAERDATTAHEGTHSQRIDINYDETLGGDFLLRHVAGARFSDYGGSQNVAEFESNLQFESIGAVGFWMKTTDPGLEVSLAIDDPVTGDRGVRRPVIADGQWREYRWQLDEASEWEAWVGAGNGQIDGTWVTLDSIQIFGASDATVFLDTVFWDPQAEFVAPPTPGDFSGDGIVDNTDLNLLLANWGAMAAPQPTGWNGAAPSGPTIDNDELNALLANWGVGVTAIPEPAALVAVALLVTCQACPRGRKS